MEYIQLLQNIGGFVFALAFLLGCNRLEKYINSIRG